MPPARIYHWKHGWIPLDHEAALSKAKGSEHGARRYLAGSHAAGHAHASVVTGEYGGGTHVRGLQPVAAGHLPRAGHITAAFDPVSRRFALLDTKGQRIGLTEEFDGKHVTASIPEDLAEHFHARGHRIVGVKHHNAGDKRILVEDRNGGLKLFKADGGDKHRVEHAHADSTARTPFKRRDIAGFQHVEPHTVIPNDGSPGGVLAAEKIKRAYRRGNKTVLIEAAMSDAQTEEFLTHVTTALDVTKHVATHPITIHVPVDNQHFDDEPGLRGYVWRGDPHRVHIRPEVATGVSRKPGSAGGRFSHAADDVHDIAYTITHEIGHTVDNQHRHTLGRHEHEFYKSQRENLSGYGRVRRVEGYAEAFAHFHLRRRHVGSPHDLSADEYGKRYGWRKA